MSPRRSTSPPRRPRSASPQRSPVDDLIAVVERTGYTAALPAPPPEPEAGRGGGGGRAAGGPGDGERRRCASGCWSRWRSRCRSSCWRWFRAAVPRLAVAVARAGRAGRAWGAWPFHRAALVNARHGAATMDTLVSPRAWPARTCGRCTRCSSAPRARPACAWRSRCWPARGRGASAIYLEVAAGVTVLILLGRYFEARAKRRSGAALRALLDARREGRARCSATAARSASRSGRLGRRRPVRGPAGGEDRDRRRRRVAARRRWTPRCSPVSRSRSRSAPGDAVTGGCVNTSGRLVVRATRVGADTQLARIARLVDRGAGGKAPVQRLADRVSAVFVPVVIVIALATLAAGWPPAHRPAPRSPPRSRC